LFGKPGVAFSVVDSEKLLAKNKEKRLGKVFFRILRMRGEIWNV
jgi:hypothetical protein